jgi:predicted helicase
VIIGNPPYNVGQINENDNNKNRKYPTIDALVSDTYAKDSKATNKNALSDVYVKAFAWATERLKNQADGVVAFVTNNGFLENLAFDGMRKHLAAEFDKIYIFDLKGNVRKSIGVQNVFNIRVGVSIIFLIKKALLDSKTEADIFYYSINDDFKRVQKLEFIAEKNTYKNLEWQEIKPDEKYNWLTEGLHDDFDSFLPMGTKEAKAAKSEAKGVIFKIYSRGAETTRDTWAYNFNKTDLINNIRISIEFYNEQVSKLSKQPKETKIDDFANYDDNKISWSSSLKKHLENLIVAEFKEENIRISLYRPFSKQYLYFDKIFTHRRGQFPSIFPTPETEAKNKVIWLKVGMEISLFALCVNHIVDLLPQSGSQCFPFYTYSEDGSHRQENITNWALKDYQTHYQDNSISKWDIFYYVYGFLHHQGYRDKYQLNLKRELPRIPYAPEFWTISQAGQQLADLHLNYEQQEPYEIQYETKSKKPDWRVKKMRLDKEKTSIIYNDTFIIKGIPLKIFDYKLGNRSALHWIIDQYQVKTDKRSGIINDPNRDDDPQYIINLVCKIITVSLKTVEIVEKINKLDFE